MLSGTERVYEKKIHCDYLVNRTEAGCYLLKVKAKAYLHLYTLKHCEGTECTGHSDCANNY